MCSIYDEKLPKGYLSAAKMAFQRLCHESTVI